LNKINITILYKTCASPGFILWYNQMVSALTARWHFWC